MIKGGKRRTRKRREEGRQERIEISGRNGGEKEKVNERMEGRTNWRKEGSRDMKRGQKIRRNQKEKKGNEKMGRNKMVIGEDG